MCQDESNHRQPLQKPPAQPPVVSSLAGNLVELREARSQPLALAVAIGVQVVDLEHPLLAARQGVHTPAPRNTSVLRHPVEGVLPNRDVLGGRLYGEFFGQRFAFLRCREVSAPSISTVRGPGKVGGQCLNLAAPRWSWARMPKRHTGDNVGTLTQIGARRRRR